MGRGILFSVACGDLSTSQGMGEMRRCGGLGSTPGAHGPRVEAVRKE